MTTETSAPPPRLLGVLFLGTLLAALDIAIVGPALPALRETFALTERAVAWTFTAFVLANLAGLPVMAALADRVGRKRVYLADVALFAAGTLVVVLAPSFGVLLAGRVLQGLGASGIFPVATAVIGDTYPPERRGRAVGMLGAVFGVAFLVGPAVGGIVLSVASWRWLFALSLPLAAVVFGLSARRLPESRAVAPGAFDAAGVATLTALLVALVVGLSGLDAVAPYAGLLELRAGGALALAAVLLAVLVVVERRADAPVIRPGLVARRPVQVACALAVGAGAVEATFVLLSAYAVAAFGVGESTASYLLLPLVAGVALGAPVSGRLLDRVGPRPVVTVAAILVALGMGTVALAPSLGIHVAGTVVLGLGLSGILGSSLSYILLAEAGADERAVAQGLSTIFLSVGQLAGAATLAALATSASSPVEGFRLGFAVVAGLGAVLVVAARALPARVASPERRTGGAPAR
ncbi:MFS transporter [Rubrivirga sp. IMCC45206]|uniref:MFS transporter n=1 Tax=Rubrivirga sp. IMCC45206 TaxID=3391614 RepID=UPI00398FCD96